MVVIVGHINKVALRIKADSNIEGQTEIPRCVGRFAGNRVTFTRAPL